MAQARRDAGLGDSGGSADGDEDIVTLEPVRPADGLMVQE